jgi:hypothetical protein
MMKSNIYLLNAPILTAYGLWQFQGPVAVRDAKEILRAGFISAIGHHSTAEFLTELLEIPCVTNRISVSMKVGDVAVVFSFVERQAEGVILEKQQIKKLPYELAVLERKQ